MMYLFKDYRWKLFILLTLLAGSALVFQMFTGIGELSEVENARITLLEIVGYAAVNLAGIVFVVFIGLLVSQRSGFDILKSDFFNSSSVLYSILIGILLAFSAIGLDFTLFNGLIVEKVRAMAGMSSRLSVIYAAAIGEEILFRFFIMSVIVWIAKWKIRSITTSIWIGIFISSVFFGIAHFPKSTDELKLMIMTRALLINGMAGIIFGWIYWKRGLVEAMIAHFSADFTIYFILPFLLNVLEIP